MSKLTSPLKNLFSSSRKLVLDFSKIGKSTPDYENFSKIFQEYRSKNLNPREPQNRQLINNTLIDSSGFRYLIGQYGEDRTEMLADTSAGREGRVMHIAVDIFSFNYMIYYIYK